MGCLPPISVHRIFLDLYRSLENGNSSSEVMETGFLRQPLGFGNAVESVILIVNISKTTIEVTLSVSEGDERIRRRLWKVDCMLTGSLTHMSSIFGMEK